MWKAVEKPAGDSSMLIQIFITLSLLLNAIPRMYFHAFMGVKKKKQKHNSFSIQTALNVMMHVPIWQKLMIKIHLCSRSYLNVGASYLIFQWEKALVNEWLNLIEDTGFLTCNSQGFSCLACYKGWSDNCVAKYSKV